MTRLHSAEYTGLGIRLGTWNFTHRHSFDEGHPDLITFWKDHVERFAGAMPVSVFNSTCCAEFIVSRARILRIPKEGWHHWLHVATSSQDDAGRVFEYLWPMLFLEGRV